MLGILARLLEFNVGRRLVSAGLNFKQQITLQIRHTTQTIVLALAGGLAALLTLGIGLIALYLWLAREFGPFVALGVLGLITGVTAFVLLAVAFLRGGPGQRSSSSSSLRPALSRVSSSARAADTGLDRLAQQAAAAGERVVGTTQDVFQEGSRKTVVGLLIVAGVLGLIVGRRL
jgi:hypothetical protein